MEEQITQFQQQKKHYLSLKTTLDNYLKEEEKTKNIILALKQDLIEQANNAKNNLQEQNFLSADDYVALKQTETGIHTRIEYYQAYLEELDEKIYQQKEILFNEYHRILKIRNEIFNSEFNALFNTFSTEQKEILDRLYMLLKHSGKIDNDDSENSIEHLTKKSLATKLMTNINTDCQLEQEWLIPRFIQYYEIKTPAQKEKQKTENKGFQKLIDNLY